MKSCVTQRHDVIVAYVYDPSHLRDSGRTMSFLKGSMDDNENLSQNKARDLLLLQCDYRSFYTLNGTELSWMLLLFF